MECGQIVSSSRLDLPPMSGSPFCPQLNWEDSEDFRGLWSPKMEGA